MRAAGDAVELVPMSFSFPPGRPGGAPVFYFRSEGRRFASSARCIVPASAFFEFTGKTYPKAKHRFSCRCAGACIADPDFRESSCWSPRFWRAA
jgi:putative SOS response-associated peptidase YedK